MDVFEDSQGINNIKFIIPKGLYNIFNRGIMNGGTFCHVWKCFLEQFYGIGVNFNRI